MKNTTTVCKGFALALMATIALFAFAGCSDDSEKQEQDEQSANMQAVLDKLDALQTQVDGIEAYLGGDADDDQPQIVMAGLETAQEFLGQLDDIEEKAAAAAVAADSVAVPENEDERPAAYFEAIVPLEELEAELDLLEDAFITAHGKGTVKSKELWQLEARKGEIENMLSLAKDSLEFRMSVDE